MMMMMIMIVVSFVVVFPTCIKVLLTMNGWVIKAVAIDIIPFASFVTLAKSDGECRDPPTTSSSPELVAMIDSKHAASRLQENFVALTKDFLRSQRSEVTYDFTNWRFVAKDIIPQWNWEFTFWLVIVLNY